MTTFLLAVASIASLALAAFCAGSETGFLSVSRERILHLAREGGRRARKVERALHDMGTTTTTLLIGNNLASVIYSTATAALSERLLGGNVTASAIWSFFAAFLVLYCSEFMPKLMFAARPLRRTLMIADAYEALSLLMMPLTRLAICLTNMFVARKDAHYRLTADDLVRILQDRKDGVCLSDVESALITKMIVLRAKKRPITPNELLTALSSDSMATKTDPAILRS